MSGEWGREMLEKHLFNIQETTLNMSVCLLLCCYFLLGLLKILLCNKIQMQSEREIEENEGER